MADYGVGMDTAAIPALSQVTQQAQGISTRLRERRHLTGPVPHEEGRPGSRGGMQPD
jgi:hypothetical protein